MHLKLALFLIASSLTFVAISQPVTHSNPIQELDFDVSGTTEIFYTFFSKRKSEMPEDWVVSYGIRPGADARILKATPSEINLNLGQVIDERLVVLTNVTPNDPGPPTISYDFGLLYYRAINMGEWVYSTVVKTGFESESDLLIGLKLSFATGTHYGWLRLSRPVVDEHTEFEVKEYRYHPVPGAPIGAGEPPGLPPLQAQAESTGLSFSWDSRWGTLVLESATNLIPPISWETVVEGNGGPVDLPVSEGQRFFRLREP